VAHKVVALKAVRVGLKVKLLVVVDRARHPVAVGKVVPVATPRALVPVHPQILWPVSWPTIRMATGKLIKKSFRSECNAF
jgi:putative NIF3 family GTP cyclohydrolase 1 type 2